MAIKNIIAKGIGFSPESISFIPTHGFSIGVAITIAVREHPSIPIIPTVPTFRRTYLYMKESIEWLLELLKLKDEDQLKTKPIIIFKNIKLVLIK